MTVINLKTILFIGLIIAVSAQLQPATKFNSTQNHISPIQTKLPPLINSTSVLSGQQDVTTQQPEIDEESPLQNTNFSCYGRPFGQYADIDEECRVFHLCHPYLNFTTGRLIYQRVSYVCGNNYVYDSRFFICIDRNTPGFRCNESPLQHLISNHNYLTRLLSGGIGSLSATALSHTREFFTDTDTDANSNGTSWTSPIDSSTANWLWNTVRDSVVNRIRDSLTI